MSNINILSSAAAIDTLIAAETNVVTTLPRHLSVHRQDSINWILNAHAHFQFQPVTAVLAVNYFDRFLSAADGAASLEWNNGWKYQLLSVACLSLAAKMEEHDLPLLMDLQVSEPRFVFGSKTILKMELLVLSVLDWRIRPVTPFDFIDYFVLMAPSKYVTDEVYFRWKCSDLVVKTIKGVDFLGFRPSVIAAAAVICVIGEGAEVPECFYQTVNKEMVRSCHRLMNEYLLDTCPLADHKVPKRPAEPPASPDGVLDAVTCISCNTHSGDGHFVPSPIFGENGREAKRARSNVQEKEL
ncbi:cyclin-like protein [Artemisia annua]|uniref:Cyclin-like protein n=1 Tax=Artemisia annua TaxID=35608 RepID=A0A2U1KDR4_ARTAN|nr:cyclin-like protein [Artemisia annua]